VSAAFVLEHCPFRALAKRLLWAKVVSLVNANDGKLEDVFHGSMVPCASRGPAAKPRPRRAAFTLIELLVVIAIIAILAALLMSSLPGAKERARRLVCKNSARQFLLAVQFYADDNGQRLPSGESNSGPLDDHLPILSNATSNSLVGYLGTLKIFQCPSFGDYFRTNVTLNEELAGYGYVCGYNYLGGHTNTPWAPVLSSTARWISPQRSTESGNLVLLTDMNDWSLVDARVFAPHGKTGPILNGIDASNQVSTNRVPSFRSRTSATIGAVGGNVGLLDGSVAWKKIQAMQVYSGSQRWGDQGCIAMW
jgi:prepilin-type N-terminal cleavage/methylation domain-containing protein